jgi:membrane protein DedA with SNARE-associated domain
LTDDGELARKDDPATKLPPPRRPVDRRVLWLLLTPAIVSLVAANVGDALAPTLVKPHPLLLIALTPRNRNLVLATNHLGAVAYYTVGGLRLLSSDPLWYLVGRLYGDRAVAWVEQKSPTYGKMLRRFEQGFGVAAWPLVFLAPNPYICLFAGAAGMAVLPFAVLNLTGTAARLFVIRWVGDIFQKPIDQVLRFIEHYRWPLLAVTVAIVVVTVIRDRRSGGGELGGIRELAAEEEEQPS